MTSRYSSHHRLNAEHPALLLEVIALLKILLVTHDTIIKHHGITHLAQGYHSNT